MLANESEIAIATEEMNMIYLLAQAAWMSMNYPVVVGFLTFVEPVFIPFGIIFNVINIVILFKRLPSLGETVQIYYFTIAVLDLICIILQHLFLGFLDYGLGLFTNRTHWFGLPDSSIQFCLFRGVLAYFAIITTSWLYVCLAAERIYAISRPLQARRFLTKKLAITLIVAFSCLSLAVDVFSMYTFTLVPIGEGQTFCYFASSMSLALAQASVLIACSVCVPAPLTAVLAIVLLIKMHLVSASRNHLVSDKADSSVSLKELSGCITVVILSLLHVVTYTSEGTTFVGSIVDSGNPWWHRMELMFAVMSSSTTCVNFLVYYFRVPGYKQRLQCKAKRTH